MPWYRLFFAKRHPVFIRTPEDRFSAMSKLGYDFTSKYLELPLGSGSSDNLPRYWLGFFQLFTFLWPGRIKIFTF